MQHEITCQQSENAAANTGVSESLLRLGATESLAEGQKKCFKCKCVKPLSEFYRHPQMKHGTLNKCKSCTIVDVAVHRAKNLDKIQQYDRLRDGELHRKLARGQYNKWYVSNRKDRHQAHAKVRRAVVAGTLKKQPCQECGSDKVEAHHHDYSKPLDVVWLCSKCHHAKHRKYNYEALVSGVSFYGSALPLATTSK